MNYRQGTGLVLLTALAFAGGCVSYATYPAVPKNTALNDPNVPAMEEVMMTGLRFVATKYPPGGRPDPTQPAPAITEPRFALNLPQGVKPRVHERVAAAVGNGAAPLTPETSHLPIYHVTYLRVRGDEAQLNVVRELTELPRTPTGQPVMQEIKLHLRGGLRPWAVTTTREWDPGLLDLPQLNYYEPVREAQVEVEGSRGPGGWY
jgi:hypothetical protein